MSVEILLWWYSEKEAGPRPRLRTIRMCIRVVGVCSSQLLVLKRM